MSRQRLPRRRSWPRIAVAAASVVLLAMGVKAGSMFWFSAAGARAYGDGSYDASIDAYRHLESWNVVDPSLAFVGIGDAWYRQGDLVEAELAFARALDLAPGDCEVRFNYAITVEAQGDRILAREPLSPGEEDRPFDPAAPRRDNAFERYSIALTIANGRPCESGRPDDAGDRLASTRERIQAKLDALRDETGDNDSPEAQEPENQDRGDGEEIEDLELRNQSGANQREQARDRDTRGVTPDGQSNW
jgi:tetratricopeptide (TPR) repeat protein